KLRRFVNDYVAPPKSAAKLAIAVETFERMRGEVAAMGGRTPHELMRCAEVTFILDCAEMAARASLTRTESRWGLYHDRADLPERDDEQWLYHLNLRRGADGRMEFWKRPVAPYLVPVEEFEAHLPRGTEPVPVAQPEVDARRAPDRPHAPARPAAGGGDGGGRDGARSPRLLELLALAEEMPGLDALRPFLADPDPAVRAAAADALTESAPDGAADALAALLADADPRPRRAAAAALRELVEVLRPGPAFAAGLEAALGSADPVVRAAVVGILRELRTGRPEAVAAALHDADHRVRLEAVRALVALGDGAAVARAAGDASREVRIAAAHGTASLGADPGGALPRLAADPDPLVRAAALAAAPAAGRA